MQYQLDKLALDMLKKSAQIDVMLYDTSTLVGKLWPGRILTFLNFAYIH
jgi:hypothetical protein